MADDIDRIREELRKRGLDSDDIDKFIKGLKELLDGKDKSDFGEQLGEILGKAAKGFATGGADTETKILLKVLDILGPSLGRGLDAVIDLLLRENIDGYDERRPGPGPHKRERINRNGPGFKETNAPDIDLAGDYTVDCLPNDRLRVRLKLDVYNREEPISRVRVLAYNSGVQCASGRVIDGQLRPTNDDGEFQDETSAGGLPKREDQKVGDRYEVIVNTVIQCADALESGGRMVFSVSVRDEDDNYSIDYFTVNVVNKLLEEDGNCCKSFKSEAVREKLLGGLLDNIRRISAKDVLDILKELDPPKDEPKAPKSTGKEIGLVDFEDVLIKPGTTEVEVGTELG